MIVVTIIYPTDPLGVIPGGTDTCIRDILRCAPPDIDVRLIGVTTDTEARPLKTWTVCDLGGRTFRFYPVIAAADLTKQMRIPLSLRFTLALLGNRQWRGSDVLQFHRLEPAILYRWNRTPKVTVIHQNMKVINSKKSDIRWKYLPGGYFFLEDFLLPKFAEIRIVRKDAVEDYRKRFPDKGEHIDFLPTWMNSSVFYRTDAGERERFRAWKLSNLGWPSDAILLLSVGRLDHQKDPLLAVEVMRSIVDQEPRARYVMIGDGVLRGEVEARIKELGLENHIHLQGAMSQGDVAEYLRCSDMMLLTSVYEGMPRCVVESLGCGIPVTTTDVGEVGLLVTTGVNGEIVEQRTAAAVSAAALRSIRNLDDLSGEPCTAAVEEFSADVVLGGLYDDYRRLADAR